MVLPRIFLRQEQKVAIASLDPFCRKPPKLPAEGGVVPVLHLWRQTKHLKGQDQVVSPQDRFQVGRVGLASHGRDLAHREESVNSRSNNSYDPRFP